MNYVLDAEKNEMKDSISPNRWGRGTEGLQTRPLARSIALTLVGAAGVAVASHEGLPFTESFDDAHLSDTAGTTADWGVTSPGQLVLPTAEPLMGPFDPSAAGEVIGPTMHITRDLDLGDLNGDGWLDLVEGSTARSGVYLNDGAGNLLARSDLTTDTGNTRGVAIGDVDRDGDLDIVAANLDSLARLYLNAGDGLSYTGYNIGTEPARADSVALEDLNGDGWLDVAVATHIFRKSVIYFHTGNAAEPFGPNGVPGQPIDTDPGLNTQTVLLGDLDNDGDHDVVLINEDQPNLFFLNDGAGTLSAPVQIGAEADDSQGGALGDVNGDGWLDLVVGNYEPGQTDKIYLNSANSAAPFSNATVPSEFSAPNEIDYTHHVALSDVDLDGDLDILLSTAGLGAADPNVTRFTNPLFLNDGTGSFAASVAIGADMDVTNAIAVGDIDGDGKPDVIAGNEDRAAFDINGSSDALPQANRLYRNVGIASGAAAVRQLSGYATSLRVDAETAPIASVALDASLTATAHDDAEFWVSSNGGANWLHAEPGAGQLVFPDAIRGTDLRWRVYLSSKSPAAASTLALDTVTLASDAPSFTSDPISSATALVAYSYDVTAVDPNGDVLTLSASTLPTWLTFVDNTNGTGSLTGVPGVADVGDHEVVLDVADANGLTDQQSFTISVVGGGNPPAFTSSPPASGIVGTEYRYDIAATDPEGDAMTFSASTLPAWLKLTDNLDGTGTLIGIPTDAELGDHEVVLDVTDANGMTAQQVFTVSVAAPATVPVFGSTPVTGVEVGSAYEYAIVVTDPEGDALTITASVLPAWLTLTDNGDGTATLAGAPAAQDVGDHAVELLATDATAAAAPQAFTITVSDPSAPPPDNSAPSFTSTAVAAATAGTAYSYTVQATDPDAGDVLAISAPTLPAWLTLTDNGDGSAALAGTPAAAHVGNHDVVLSVADAAGATAQQTFTIAVAAATPPPSNQNPPPPPPPASSGGGGGSTGLLELLGMACAAFLVRLRRRRPLA